jgi:hypothetical protein
MVFFAIKRELMKNIIDTYSQWVCKYPIDIHLFNMHKFYQTSSTGLIQDEVLESLRTSNATIPPCIDREIHYRE